MTRLAAAGVLLRDLGEHRLKDLPEPETLAQAVGEGLLAEFPPPRAAQQPPLPVAAPERSILVAPERVGRPSPRFWPSRSRLPARRRRTS